MMSTLGATPGRDMHSFLSLSSSATSALVRTKSTSFRRPSICGIQRKTSLSDKLGASLEHVISSLEHVLLAAHSVGKLLSRIRRLLLQQRRTAADRTARCAAGYSCGSASSRCLLPGSWLELLLGLDVLL